MSKTGLKDDKQRSAWPRNVLTKMDLQRRSSMPGDQKVMSPSWLQQMNEPSGGVSRMRRTGSRCGVGLDLAGSWKPTWRARTYESSISPYSSCMYVQNSSHVMAPWDVQSIFWNNASICFSCHAVNSKLAGTLYAQRPAPSHQIKLVITRKYSFIPKTNHALPIRLLPYLRPKPLHAEFYLDTWSGAYLEGGRTGAPPKLSKIVATRCQILRLKCTKFNFGWGSAPDPAGGAYSAPPDPLAGLRGPTSKGREVRGG